MMEQFKSSMKEYLDTCGGAPPPSSLMKAFDTFMRECEQHRWSSDMKDKETAPTPSLDKPEMVVVGTKKLGSGGEAEVFEAFDLTNQRIVAVKKNATRLPKCDTSNRTRVSKPQAPATRKYHFSELH
eukprot:PhF_6_TR24774/c0_g1_i3/m.34023